MQLNASSVVVTGDPGARAIDAARGLGRLVDLSPQADRKRGEVEPAARTRDQIEVETAVANGLS
jgi:hypothetical protein